MKHREMARFCIFVRDPWSQPINIAIRKLK